VTEQKDSSLNLTVAGTADAIMMVEAGASEISEDIMTQALELAVKSWQPAIKIQQELVEKVGVEAKPVELFTPAEEVYDKVSDYLKDRLGESIRSANKQERHEAIMTLHDAVVAEFGLLPEDVEPDGKQRYSHPDVEVAFEKVVDREIRRAILEDGARPDNRKNTEIRPISSQVGLLPRTHGSALFTRGTTQALSIVTLASASAAQLVDTMEEDGERHYIHHYNFPPFSTGEARPMRSTGRREIGHGYLAERALLPVVPKIEDFPYTIRVVSELLSSAGSTSMASVCGSTMSLMDAGVPISKPVSGIAMGLMINHDDPSQYVILSDLQDAEDFAGDMDFKVAGTADGITALQMDIKIKGIPLDIMSAALEQAKQGRAEILAEMLKTIQEPRAEMSPYAPRITTLQIDTDKIRDVIGKGGETIQKIIAETGVEIDINDDGLVMVASADQAASKAAIDWINSIVEEPEVGKVYDGKVVRLMDFGAFVEILPGREGLVHISQIRDERVEKISDELEEGQDVKVKLVEIDDRGRLNLSMKAAQQK
jgi:polyribonucleotide nucleotidyltransferase